MGDLVSAAPEELRRFHEVAGDTCGVLVRRAAAVDGAMAWLARSGSTGLGGLPSDLGAWVGRHARAVDALGAFAGDVGDAFASIGAVAGPAVVAEEHRIVDWLADRWAETGAQSPHYPDDWPGLVPGENGCPAISLPTWFGIGNDRGERETFDEPLWTAVQTDCDPIMAERTESRVLVDADGVLVPLGPEIVEARRLPRPQPASRPGNPQAPQRVLPIAPPESTIWTEADRHRGPVRRLEDGSYAMWDYTHGEIEVFGRDFRHRGAMDPITGDMIKPPVPGRQLPRRYR